MKNVLTRFLNKWLDGICFFRITLCLTYSILRINALLRCDAPLYKAERKNISI